MPTWVKVILILVAIVVLGFAAVGFFTYRWVRSNKGAFEATLNQGRTFGSGKDATLCVDEALRHLGSGGITAALSARMLVRGCLESATPSPDLCRGVPPETELMASGKWLSIECSRRGVADQRGCVQVLQEVVRHCEQTRGTTGR